MIKLTGLNNREFYLNCDLIEKLESTPDTVITLTSGKKFIARESPEEIIESIVKFRRRLVAERPEVIK